MIQNSHPIIGMVWLSSSQCEASSITKCNNHLKGLHTQKSVFGVLVIKQLLLLQKHPEMELKGLEISLASQEHPLNFISLVMLKSLSCSFLASTASLTSQWECAKFIFQPLCTEIYSQRSSKFQIRPSRLESVVWLRPKLCLEKEKVEWLEVREGF